LTSSANKGHHVTPMTQVWYQSDFAIWVRFTFLSFQFILQIDLR